MYESIGMLLFNNSQAAKPYSDGTFLKFIFTIECCPLGTAVKIAVFCFCFVFLIMENQHCVDFIIYSKLCISNWSKLGF